MGLFSGCVFMVACSRQVFGSLICCKNRVGRSSTFNLGSVPFGSIRFGSVAVQFGSVRFGSVRFSSVPHGSIRFG